VSASPWRLRFWGVRGSFPAPGSGTVRYGGHTACLAFEGPGPAVILDAGSGLMPCGQSMVANDGPRDVEILLSHTHLDHLLGLPFFAPLYREGWTVRLRGPKPERRTLQSVVDAMLDQAVFPLPAAQRLARFTVEELGGGPFEVAGWTVRTCRLNHPGPTVAFRLDRPGVKSVAYVTDNELDGITHGVSPDWRAGLVDFLSGVDTLVHDTMFMEAELTSRAGWGHSSPRRAIQLAADAGCGELLLFHHDVFKDDDSMDAMVQRSRLAAAELAPGLSVDPAIEGTSLTLEER